MKKALVFALVFLLCAPMFAVFGIGMFMSPALATACVGSLTVGEIPDSLTATKADGEEVTLGRAQLTHAATIITVGGQIEDVGTDGVRIALMAALMESSLRMLANSRDYPESLDYPNDGAVDDRDTLGMFQMRPVAGWGTVAELMRPEYQVQAFMGGPDGPNEGSPRGLLDIPGWQAMEPGAAAQAVEVSEHPERYAAFQPVADAIIAALTKPGTGGNGGGTGGGSITETESVVVPMPAGGYTITSLFGWRTDPVTGNTLDFHTGTDFAAPDGSPILATADGVVLHAGFVDGWGLIIVIDHTVDGKRVSSMYHHMWEHGIHVSPGDRVTAGQQIGEVGSWGYSTGPHLHFQIHPGGWGQDPVDSLAWLEDHGATAGDVVGGGVEHGRCSV